MSLMAPASSTPVGPPPMTTKLSGGCQPCSCIWRSASSKASRTRRRISVASSMVFRPGASGAHSFFAEVGVRGTGGKDEVVVGKMRAGGEAHATGLHVDCVDLVHEDLGVGLVAQDGADGLGDVCRRKDRERHLVEQRLEGVVVLAIDDGDVDGEVAQRLGGVKASESCTDDDHAWTLRSVRRPQVASSVRSFDLALKCMDARESGVVTI